MDSSDRDDRTNGPVFLNETLVIIIVITMLITIISAAILMMNTNEELMEEPVVRPAVQAGRFYEDNPQRLSHQVDSFLALHNGCDSYKNAAALIVPHAGHYY